jgi:hypothetical protein
MGRVALLSPALIVTLPLLLSACARPNPAFDGRERSEGSEDASGDGDGDADTLGTGKDEGEDASGDGDAESDSSTGDGDGDDQPIPDVPDEPLCPWQPSPGLAIRVGSPANFGGQCPTAVHATVTFVEAVGGDANMLVCNEDCSQCITPLFVAAPPLNVTNYFPNDPGVCLTIHAETPLGGDLQGCYFGSISMSDWVTQRPYVIATTRSAPPPTGVANLVGSLVPDPLSGGTCDCAQIGLGEASCCLDSAAPEIWYYPVDGEQLFAGDSIALVLPNADATIDFKVFQAERIGDCINDGAPQLSWALVDAP